MSEPGDDQPYRALAAARAAERRLQAVLDGLGSSVFVKDLEGRYTFVNHRFLLEAGLARDDVLGRTVEELNPSAAAEHIRAHDEAVVASGEQRTDVVRSDVPGQPVRSYVVVKLPLRDDSGTVVALAGVATDVTEHELAVESAERLAAVVQGSPDYVATVDAQMRVTSLNPAAERLSGTSAEDVIGRPFPEVVDQRRRELATQIVSRTLAGEVLPPEEQVWDQPEGQVHVVVQVLPISGPDGGVAGAAVVVRDVTAERLADAERLELERRVEHMERLESLGQLAGGVAHDFNNLLAAISLTAELLRTRLGEGTMEREQTDRLLAMTERGVALTRELLVFSRREARHQTVVDLNDVVRRCDVLLERVLGEHVERRLELTGEPATVLGDLRQLEQVVVNLATNARDAMPGGGLLRIRTALVDLDDLGRQRYRTTGTGRHVELLVEDEGAGMAAGVSARAFEPFFTTKPAGEGTGLGLAAVYSIAAQAGGGAAIYSEPGTGTVVRVVLPYVSSSPATSPPRLEPDEPQAHGEHVFVVEDERDLREIASRVLVRAGFRVSAFADSARALAALEAGDEPPDVLLTDVVLPGRSGPELAVELRSRLPGLRVVLMSGYTAGLVAESAPADAVLLEKPFRAVTLLTALRDALDAPQP